LLDLTVDKSTVSFKFDSSSLDGQKSNTFLNSLKSITDAEDETKSVLNDAQNTANNIKGDLNGANDIITTPDTTSSQTTNTTTANSDGSQATNNKTVIKELTYKVAKNDGDGSMISPYFTNTAKVMQNPDGTYYVEMTIKYPKKFGNNAIQLNYINHEKPTNLSFTSSGDSNYLKFDFPINNLGDLGEVISGNATLNLPDFNLDKDLNFDLNFDGFNPSDISGIVSSSDVSGLLSDLSSLSNAKNVKTDKATNDNRVLGTLPQTGEQTNAALGIIGGLILVLWIVLLKATYLKK
jgi:Gram positive anchor.